MNSTDAKQHGEHVKAYLKVFYALLFMTGVTVAASTLDVSLFWGVAIALAIAAFKGSLVAWNFMHVKAEGIPFYAPLALVVAFFLVLFFVPVLVVEEVSKYRIEAPPTTHDVEHSEGH